MYKNGSDKPFTGIGTSHWDNGNLQRWQPIVDGQEHGWATSWHQDGKKSMEGEWTNGEQTGTWTSWTEKGDKVVRDMDTWHHGTPLRQP